MTFIGINGFGRIGKCLFLQLIENQVNIQSYPIHRLDRKTSGIILLAKQKKYTTNIKAGRYKIDRALNNNELVNLLRSGKQTPVKVTFNNLRTKEQLAGKIANQIEADSFSILSYITDTVFQQKLGLNNNNIACLFIPNTYEFYWNTSAEQFVNRMLKEYKLF